MGFFEQFPWSNFHDLNLDWLLSQMKKLGTAFDAFVSSNVLKYADPIGWSIANQYEANTIVRNGEDVYLSKKAVPAGVAITNADYWFQVGDLSTYALELDTIRHQIAADDEGVNLLASQSYAVGAVFWLNEYLSRATEAIEAGATFVYGVNYERVTVMQLLEELQADIDQNTADISTLTGTTIPAINTAISALQSKTRNNTLIGRKCVCIGDSYGTGTGGTVGQGWPYWFKEYSGADTLAYYGSGAGFTNTSNGNGNVPSGLNFEAILTNYAAAGLTEAERAEYEYVICCGGINDGGSTTVVADVRSFILAAQTYFPNAKIVIVPLYCDAHMTIARKTAMRSVYLAAMTRGVLTYWNSVYWLMGDSAMGYGDNNHPSALGYQRIGAYLATLINGGEPVNNAGSGGVNYASGWTLTQSSMWRENNMVNWCFDVSFTGTVSPGNTFATLAEVMRPAVAVWVPVYVFGGTRYTTMLQINPNGNVIFAPGTINGHAINEVNNPRIFGQVVFNFDNVSIDV